MSLNNQKRQICGYLLELRFEPDISTGVRFSSWLHLSSVFGDFSLGKACV